jgi:hypothetical protein
MSTDTPPRSAATWPSSDVPAPNGTIGHRRALVDVERIDDEVRRRRRVERLVRAVLAAHVHA